MQVEPAGRKILPRAGGSNLFRNAPVFAIELHQFAARRQAGKLLQQQTPMHAATQRELADKLFVSGFLTGGAGNARHQFTIGHDSRLQLIS